MWHSSKFRPTFLALVLINEVSLYWIEPYEISNIQPFLTLKMVILYGSFNVTYFFSGTPFQGTKTIPHFHAFFVYFKDKSRRVGLNTQPLTACPSVHKYRNCESNRRKSLKPQLLQNGTKKVLKQK